jgi:hypothetical protein
MTPEVLKHGLEGIQKTASSIIEGLEGRVASTVK